jgi:hypothetical protein
MLERTPIWTSGTMHLYINNKPATVYVNPDGIEATYSKLQDRIKRDGKINIGIDHLSSNIIKDNPILAKLDLLNIGQVTDIDYKDGEIRIAAAEITNPQLLSLYEQGELDAVSIVGTPNIDDCHTDKYDYVVRDVDIERVDIVSVGACPTCKIPHGTNAEQSVYARMPIINEMEAEQMADEEITMETIQEIVSDALSPFNEQLQALTERVDALDGNAEDNKPADENEELEAKHAELEKIKMELAETKADTIIAAGKATPAQREAMIKLAAADGRAFDDMYENAPVIVDLDNRQSLEAGRPPAENAHEMTDDEKLIAEVESAFKRD